MKNLKLASVVLLALIISVISCSKGTVGPAGPAGPAGPDSVLHSPWISLATTQGLDSFGDTIYSQTLTALSITQTILDSGLILSYIEFPNGNVVDVSDLSYGVDVEYAVGSIEITSYEGDLTGYGFRYIIVPGSLYITSSLKGYTGQQLKTMTYSTITKLLGITDTPRSN
jgi:hypothetical protein